MKQIVGLFFVLCSIFACKTNSSKSNGDSQSTFVDEVANQVGKVFPENVYELNKQGEKKSDEPVFIIEGTKMYTVEQGKDEKKLFLEKRGKFIYDMSGDGSNIVMQYENDKYWEFDEKTGEKKELLFERKGKYIFSYEDGKEEKLFLVE